MNEQEIKKNYMVISGRVAITLYVLFAFVQYFMGMRNFYPFTIIFLPLKLFFELIFGFFMELPWLVRGHDVLACLALFLGALLFYYIGVLIGRWIGIVKYRKERMRITLGKAE